MDDAVSSDDRFKNMSIHGLLGYMSSRNKPTKRFTFTIAHGVCLWRANGVWYHNPRYWTALDGTKMVTAPRVDEIGVPKIFRPINWNNGEYQVLDGSGIVIGVSIEGGKTEFTLTKKYI